MITAGIDIGLSKPTIIVLINREEKIYRIDSEEGEPEKVIKRVPPVIDLVAWEKPYHKHNTAVLMALQAFATELRVFAKIKRYEYTEIMPAHWQQPIRDAFGLRKTPGMSAVAWENLKMEKYEIFVRKHLVPGLDLSDNLTTRKDQIAAACIGLHAHRRAKQRIMLGMWK